MAAQKLSNEEWGKVLLFFADIVDEPNAEELIAEQADEGVRGALQDLWRQHKDVERLRFLEEQMTVVSALSMGGPVVFHPGQILAGRFAILRALGRGGMGEVYLAEDQRLMETVAVKTIKREFARDAGIRARFLKEVQNSRRVTHPNVCRIFEFFEHDGVPFYSMEYVAGPTLGEVLKAGRLNAERAKALAIQIADGLCAAHSSDVLHCDLKPANVLLAGSGKNERAVITDFGLARALGRTDLAQEGISIAGTVPFMAPELLDGTSNTVSSDIYAFGKVLDEMLPGNKLAHECTAVNIAERPESVASVLKQLRGGGSRRRWIRDAGLGALVAGSIYLYEHYTPKIPLGSRQRVRVNGFSPEADDKARVVRNLLMMALRQSSMLSVMGDKTYLAGNGLSQISAGFTFPLGDLLASARDERVGLAIAGTLETVNPGLRLTVHVYDPASAKLLYQTHVEVEDSRDVVQLAERAATKLRISAFGESGLHSTYMPLDQITSTSKEAVDYYFQAVFHYEQSDATQALVLLDKALALDSRFALAHHYKGLALSSRRMMESAQASSEIAFANRSRVSERERNWIDSQYYNIISAFTESAEALRKNTVLFPDEAVFERQLAFALTRLGIYEEAIKHNRRAIELDPFSQNNTSELLVNLAEANRVREGLDEAKKFEMAGMLPVLKHRDMGFLYLQQGEYAQSLSEYRQLGDGTTERDSWATLLSLQPMIMSGRFSEAIEAIQGDLALDASRLAGNREEARTYMRRNALGHLLILKDSPDLAKEQADFLVHLHPLACNLIHLREGAILAVYLKEPKLAEECLGTLRQIAAKWPFAHGESAVWFTEAMLKDLNGESGAGELYAKAKGTWPDPIHLLEVARWEGKTGLLDAQLDTLAELERLRGKVYKHHFAGLVVFGWMERAKSLQRLSRFDESLRVYQRVKEQWSNSQAAGKFMNQALKEEEHLRRRLQ